MTCKTFSTKCAVAIAIYMHGNHSSITNIQVVVLDQVKTLVSNVQGANRNANYMHMKGCKIIYFSYME